jgi:hypothetical protein
MKAMTKQGLSAGFTMVEMIISVTLLAVMVIAVGMTSRKATDAFSEGTSVDALNSQAHRSIERLLMGLQSADAGELGPRPEIQNGWHRMTYRVATGWDAGITQWGPPMELELELEPGEVDDGIDNDGDGLIDEGMLVWTENEGVPGERRVVICRGVRELLEGELPNSLDDNGNGLIDEPGFCVEVGSVVTLRLTLDALDPKGRVLTKTVESSVWIRN